MSLYFTIGAIGNKSLYLNDDVFYIALLRGRPPPPPPNAAFQPIAKANVLYVYMTI